MIDFRLALTAATALPLAACADNSPVANEARYGDPAAAVVEANRSAAIANAADATTNVATTSGPIPAALQGRWGLTPADCEPARVRPTGLLEISGDRLLFYESVAEPAAGIEAEDDSISGRWNFQGEGMTEQRFQSLALRDGKLMRRENGPSSSFTYVRCNGS